MNGEHSNPEFGPPRYGDLAPPRPAMQPRRKSKAPLLIGLVAMAVVAVLCAGGVVASLASGSLVTSTPRAGGDPGADPYRSALAPDPGLTVVLSVEGTGKADISFNINGTGGSRMDAALPWTETIDPLSDFLVASLVIQDKTGSKTQKLTGRITIGARSFVCDATGAYSVATCSGSTSS